MSKVVGICMSHGKEDGENSYIQPIKKICQKKPNYSHPRTSIQIELSQPACISIALLIPP
jgi:hypothetical protein